MAQSAIEVGGSYTEENSDHDYELFGAQNGPFMAGLPSETNRLALEVRRLDSSYGLNNAQRISVQCDDPKNSLTEASELTISTENRVMSGKNPFKHRLFVDHAQSIDFKEQIQHSDKRQSSSKNGRVSEQKVQQRNLMFGPGTTVITHMNNSNGGNAETQILSPTPDHYNMQLLAHSAQQKQLLEEQKHQPEIFLPGSSSAALQHFAKLRQLQEQGQADMLQKKHIACRKACNSPFHITDKETPRSNTPLKHVHQPHVTPGQSAVIALPLPAGNLMQTPSKIGGHLPGYYSGWPVSDRGTPDFVRGHVRDLSFGSQDSPSLSMQPSEGKTKMYSLSQHQKYVNINSAPLNNEPELKSPLDHPEHPFNRQKNRFFYADSGAASTGEQQTIDDEAPLNETDKKAAAALSELLESEKVIPIQVQSFSTKFPHDAGTIIPQGTATPAGVARILQLQQEIMRNSPPPTYDQTLLPEQTLQLLHGHVAAPFMGPPALLCIDNNHGKRNAHASSSHCIASTPEPVRQNYVYGLSTQMKAHCNPESTPLERMPSHMMRGTVLATSERALQGNATCSANLEQTDAYTPMPTRVCETVNESSQSSKSVTQPRARRTSSTSSTSSNRKYEGSLTCSLCGHTFRSTPALNGHMRIHSSSDKKQIKEERSKRSISSDYAMKPSPSIGNSTPPTPFPEVRKPTDLGLSIDSNSIVFSPETSVPIQPVQEYVPDPLNQPMQNRQHNGLLTMASAACFLKTESSRGEYFAAAPMLPQAYVVPHTMLFQQPSVVNVFNSNLPESHPSGKPEVNQMLDPQGVNYSQIYAAPFQQGLPFSNLILPNMAHVPQSFVPQDSLYQVYQQADPAMIDPENNNIHENQQPYVTNQLSVNTDIGQPEENRANHCNFQRVPTTNSLSQLASVAVLAENLHRNVPESEVTSNVSADFSQNNLTNTVVSSVPPQAMDWISTDVPHALTQECMQQELYQDVNVTAETSPIRSGNDPFILPVSASFQEGPHYKEYGVNSDTSSSAVRKGPMVTWQDNDDVQNHLLSSYDDTLMQDAVNVANPSKILPNSMMGGTPPTGTFSGVRPFRHRHHSEGAHLLKSSDNSVLKNILSSQVSTADLRISRNQLEVLDLNASALQEALMNVQSTTGNCTEKKNSVQAAQSKTSDQKPKEFWAEPKPIQRRIRRRRHSADSRCTAKSGLLVGSRQFYQTVNPSKIPMKKSSVHLPEARVRHRPPPLVIPSSVSTLTTGVSVHQNIYQSNLRHRRWPSGESSSSINDKIPPYTPPPMLSPMRAGSGLYCKTPATLFFNKQKSVEGAIPTIIEEDETQEDDEELVRSLEPKINVGSRFQAVVPDLCSKDAATKCQHKADRIWKCGPTQYSDEVYKHVQQFMELSCSALVPFGGANKEFALDCLAQSNGDILGAVRCLITKVHDCKQSDIPLKNYTGAGKPWTSEEVKRFDSAMLLHRKDFFIISKAVKTRSTAECVERYYHIVKRHRRRGRLPRRFREQENESFIIRLENSPRTRRKLKSGSLTSSSSDEELTPQKVSADGSSEWLPHGRDRDSPSGISGASNSHTVVSQTIKFSGHSGTAKPLKTHTARMQHQQLGSPSPAASPSSVLSCDEQPIQIFTCPVCGKSFGKVKSRNAHMKTHGKHAQEKRRQKEEEAARRKVELASRHKPRHPVPVSIHRAGFVHPDAPNNSAPLYQHPQNSMVPRPPHCIVPRFGSNM